MGKKQCKFMNLNVAFH